MSRLETVKKKIKENPLPAITAAACVTGAVAISYKLGAASTVTVGDWQRKLEKDGFDIIILPRAMSDKIVPSVPRR